jgi:signal transduction histidine kinase
MVPRQNVALSTSALNALLDALTAPAVVTDSHGVMTFANAAAMEWLGADKLIGLPLAEHLARVPAFTPAGSLCLLAEHPIARVIAERAPVAGVRLRMRGPDRIERTWTVSAVPLFRDGALEGSVSVFHVADSVGAAMTSGRVEAIVDAVSEALFIVAADGRLVFSNAAARRQFALPDRASLDDVARRLDPRDLDRAPISKEALPVRRALAGETISGMQCIVTDAAGGERSVVINVQPLRRSDGSTEAALVTFQDVTNETQARAELEEARETAEEANRLKDDFIAALSHELRTPLQPILGWTEVLRRHGKLDAVTAQALEAIRRNIRQQVRLVDDLLDLSRIVHGKFALRYETFDLREHVRAATEPFEETAVLKRARMTVSLPPEPALMWGDGARVQQITANLVSNAVKFTRAGGHINVQLVVGEDEAMIEVEDDGEGIASEDVSAIFDAFRQGAAGRRRGGLGIGLDLVRRLAHLHGGSVEAFSEGVGYGARFVVRLPLGRHKGALTERSDVAGRRLDRREILVVEDNVDTREVMKYMLEAEGAHVVTAETGQEAVRVAQMFRPDIVLCDIGLPDVDGLEVARRIRRQSSLERTRLIALTGYGRPEDVQLALDAGFEAHVTKPINLDQLLGLLAED